MISSPIASRLSSLFFCAFVFIGCLLAFAVETSAGFLYVLNQQNGAPNQIHGFSVNESTGALTQLAGFPMPSGGNGGNTIGAHLLTIDRVDRRLYVLNSGSNNVTAFSLNDATGALTFGSVQIVNTLGTTGLLTGIAYQPPVFTVTNLNTTLAGSLHQAVQDANAAGGGVIVFDPNFFNVPRVISSPNGQFDIASHTTINGPGAHLLTVRNGLSLTGSSRVFFVGSGFSVELRGMTITGGNVNGRGGGIQSDFPTNILMVRDCWINGNTAVSFGGGIYNSGTLHVVGSTISGNVANGNAPGGGVDSIGTTFVTGTTISGNVKNVNINNGGGIFIGNVPLTITNSTITNNFANGGAGGIFDGSGGGSPVLSIRNSIIAGNRNNAATPDVAGDFASGGFNIVGNVGAATGFGRNSPDARAFARFDGGR